MSDEKFCFMPSEIGCAHCRVWTSEGTIPRYQDAREHFFFRRDVLGSQRNYRSVVWVEILVILDILLVSILANRLLTHW